ncbi:lipid phosphate phosphatase 2-like [Eucalyptus grandis]|uniref:lipid phosphate phosphatase 2-like n=1 Tax=Eucalyptus grandis TaxID=71139 RepID=UPI00192F0291|nr:lipid phosphate phosphatase 2-like [Eucalyptus grandis]
MPDIELGSHTPRSLRFKVAMTQKHDWLILLLLLVIEAILLMIEPFRRLVGMMTDMKYPPLKTNTALFWAVPILAIVLPFVVFLIYYFTRDDVHDFRPAILGLISSVALTAMITDALKDTVGRPRPDLFWRSFPDGIGVFDPMMKDVICHGDKAVIKEGYKSFPSGHTSWSFAGLSYLSWYLAGKIRAFDRWSHIAKLCIIHFPLLLVAFVAISRVDDYWRHCQDVFAGALLGSVVAAFCYSQFFPHPNDMNGMSARFAASSNNKAPKIATSFFLSHVLHGLYPTSAEVSDSLTLSSVEVRTGGAFL